MPRISTIAHRSMRLLIGLLLLASAGSALALDAVMLSPDVTVALSGTVASDDAVAVDDLLGVVALASLGALPEGAAVTAYHLEADGDQLFALDVAAELAGAVVVGRRDVVRWDGAVYALELDGSAAGIPEGAVVDAVSRTSGGDLLLSFATTVALGATLAADEDLVRWDGAEFQPYFDGTAEGIDERLDLDAAHDLGDGTLGLSFDAGGEVGGIAFDDDDVLVFDPGGPTWTLAYDGSAEHSELAAADVEAIALAVPEPGRLAMLASGLVFLAGARRRCGVANAAACDSDG